MAYINYYSDLDELYGYEISKNDKKILYVLYYFIAVIFLIILINILYNLIN